MLGLGEQVAEVFPGKAKVSGRNMGAGCGDAHLRPQHLGSEPDGLHGENLDPEPGAGFGL